MESYPIRTDSVSSYESGLANQEQTMNITNEGNPFDQLDFSKIGGLDLSSYGFTGLTPSNSGSYALSPTQSMAYTSIFESNSIQTYTGMTTICPEFMAQPSSIKQSPSSQAMDSQPIQKSVVSQDLIQTRVTSQELVLSPSPSPNQQSPILGSKPNITVDYFDVTPFIQLSQEKAAQKLGIPKSTLSKRWREATCNRKWPYRQLCKLDREIKTIIHNMQTHGAREPQLQENLATLMKMRQEESRVVYIKNMGHSIRSSGAGITNSQIKIENIRPDSIVKMEPNKTEQPTVLSSTLWAQVMQNNLAGDLLKNLNVTNL